MILSFPSFNLFSMPLLILVLQGYIFAFLLLRRFSLEKHWADLFLGLLLIITGFDRTSYIIGFMEWYDTFRNTKINYFLLDFSFAMGPLLYLYVKSLTEPGFTFRKIYRWHFLPILISATYEIAMLVYDANQPGFQEVQNGVWLEQIHYRYIMPFLSQLSVFSILLYFAFSFQEYYRHRSRIKEYFSNTYRVELNWIRNFLFVYFALFIFQFITYTIHNEITELHWQQRWWWHFASALALVYVGIKGYFTDLSKLYELTFPEDKPTEEAEKEQKEVNQLQSWQQKLSQYMNDHSPYLNPELTLPGLARELEWNPSLLSQVINTGFGKNFNDYVNSYRVDAIKEQLRNGEHKQHSLLGIALDCGFNSKATFNRTFKKLTHQSPSEFLATLEVSNDRKQEIETT